MKIALCTGRGGRLAELSQIEQTWRQYSMRVLVLASVQCAGAGAGASDGACEGVGAGPG